MLCLRLILILAFILLASGRPSPDLSLEEIEKGKSLFKRRSSPVKRKNSRKQSFHLIFYLYVYTHISYVV